MLGSYSICESPAHLELTLKKLVLPQEGHFVTARDNSTMADASVWRGASCAQLAAGSAPRARLEELFGAADADADGIVGGADAILFFKPSGLSNAELSAVWLDASKRRGCIESLGDFERACCGVAAAVMDREGSGGMKQKTRRRRRRKKADLALGGWLPAAEGSVADIYAKITAKDRAKYQAHFARADKTDAGLVARDEAQLLFGRAKVPGWAIDAIFDHCVEDEGIERPPDGLDLVAFAAAMHLVYAALRAKLANLLEARPAPEEEEEEEEELDEEADEREVQRPITQSEGVAGEAYSAPAVAGAAAVDGSFFGAGSPERQHHEPADVHSSEGSAPAAGADAAADSSSDSGVVSSEYAAGTASASGNGAQEGHVFNNTLYDSESSEDDDVAESPAQAAADRFTNFGTNAAFEASLDGFGGDLAFPPAEAEPAAAQEFPPPEPTAAAKDAGFGDFDAAFNAAFPPAAATAGPSTEGAAAGEPAEGFGDNETFAAASPPLAAATSGSSDDVVFEAAFPRPQAFGKPELDAVSPAATVELAIDNDVDESFGESPAFHTPGKAGDDSEDASTPRTYLAATSEKRPSVRALSEAFNSPGVMFPEKDDEDRAASEGAAATAGELEAMQREEGEVAAELRAVEGRKAQVTAQTKKLERERDDLRQTIGAKTAALFESKKVLAELEQGLTKAQAEAGSAREESGELQAELNALKQRKLELVSARETAAARGSAADAARSKGRSDEKVPSGAIKSLRAEVEALEMELAAASAAGANDALDEDDAEVAEVTALTVHKQRLAKELRIALEAQHSRKQSLFARRTLARDAMSVAEALVESRRAELNAVRAQNDALEQELSEGGVSVPELRARTAEDAAMLDAEIAEERERSVGLVAAMGAESSSGGHERQASGLSDDGFIEFGRHNRKGSTTRWAFDPVAEEAAHTAVASPPKAPPEAPEPSTGSAASAPGSVVKSQSDVVGGFSSFLYGGGGAGGEADSAPAPEVGGATVFIDDDAFGESAFSPRASAAEAEAEAPKFDGARFDAAFGDAPAPAPEAAPAQATAMGSGDAFGDSAFGDSAFSNPAFAESEDAVKAAPQIAAPLAAASKTPKAFDDDPLDTTFDTAVSAPPAAETAVAPKSQGMPTEAPAEAPDGAESATSAPVGDGLDDLIGQAFGDDAAASVPPTSSQDPPPQSAATFDPTVPPIDLSELMPKQREVPPPNPGGSAGGLDDLFGGAPSVTAATEASDSGKPSGMDFLFGADAPRLPQPPASTQVVEGVDDIFASLGGTAVQAPLSPDVAKATAAAATPGSSGSICSSRASAASASARPELARVRGLRTLSNTERGKIERTFTALSGGRETVSLASARSVFGRIVKHAAMFDAVWELAARKGGAVQGLPRADFNLFMHLAKQLARRGAALPPPPLTAAERAHLLGANRRRSNATTPNTSAHSTPQLSPRDMSPERPPRPETEDSAATSTSTGGIGRGGKPRRRVPRLRVKPQVPLQEPVPMKEAPARAPEPDREPQSELAPPPPMPPAAEQLLPRVEHQDAPTEPADARVGALVAMGFSREGSQVAVDMYGDNTDAAVNFLVEHPEAGKAEAPHEAAPPPAVPPSPVSVASSDAAGAAFASPGANASLPVTPSSGTSADDSDASGSGARAGAGAPSFRFCVDSVTVKQKDADRMQLPFFQMSLATPDGKLLERQQKTAPNTGRTGTGTLLYGPSTAMGFRTPLSRLPKDAAVYFELTHYKQDKKKNSLMAWSFAPVSMIKTGKFSLPLFEKPIDVSRRRTKRINKKELDLTVSFSIPQQQQ